MRYREWTLGFIAAAMAIGLAPACGGSDDEDVVLANGGKKDAGTGGKKDAGADASSGGTAGASGNAGASGSAGASGGGGTAGSGDGGTAGTSSGGSAGAGGTKPDGGNTGGAGGGCPDPLNEPNETEAAATKVGDADDCDAPHTVDGILKGKELDWFTYLATDLALTCTPNPTVSTDQPTLRACVFASCTNGATSVTCAQGSTATSPAGRSGCCSTGGKAEISINCSNLLNTKDANIFMRVDQPAGDACLAYKLTYSN